MKNKDPFEFESTIPSFDLFEVIRHKINQDDYVYFKLERRYGPSWWLYGMKPVEKPHYHWEETEIGKINATDLQSFIEWAKTEYGNRILDMHMISGSFDIFDEISKLSNEKLIRENERLKRLLDNAVNGLQGNCKECAKKESCTERRGRHDYCWEWRYDES